MHQIIVYRNPAEAYFWNALTSSENIFPIFLSCIVFFIILLVSDSIIRKSKVKFKNKEYASLFIASVCAIFTAWNMWI